jgi:NADP-dependent 3-hydroxy acid dehydrogenase YdfG
MEQLEGRVAVVTGAANGIGRALASTLAAEKMNVVLADIEGDTVERAASEIAGGGAQVLAVPTDVSDPASMDRLAAATIERFGAVHLLCSNAGVAGQFGRTWATDLAEWQWVYAVNVMGTVHAIRSFVPLLLDQDEGHVLVTGSAACFEALPGFGVYASSKHAVLGVCEALRRELDAAGAHVGVTVGMPGGVVKTTIMSGQRNWIDRYGKRPPADADALPSSIRHLFDEAVAGGTDPSLCARAFVDGVKRDLYLVCEDMQLMAAWSARHADQGRGEKPTWPTVSA